MDRERILAKIDELNQYIAELEAIMPQNFEEYVESIEERRACERLLQIAIECILDICALLVKELKLGLPSREGYFKNIFFSSTHLCLSHLICY